ncbi:hypothetical protein BC2230_60244 [Burkholderia cepacia]
MLTSRYFIVFALRSIALDIISTKRVDHPRAPNIRHNSTHYTNRSRINKMYATTPPGTPLRLLTEAKQLIDLSHPRLTKTNQ